MRIFLSATIWLAINSITLNAQVGINSSGSEPNNSAGLDVDFSNKGFLPPRLTSEQRNGIVDPAEGLQVFNTTTKCLEHFVNSQWQPISCACSTPVITSTMPGSRCGEGAVTSDCLITPKTPHF